MIRTAGIMLIVVAGCFFCLPALAFFVANPTLRIDQLQAKDSITIDERIELAKLFASDSRYLDAQKILEQLPEERLTESQQLAHNITLLLMGYETLNSSQVASLIDQSLALAVLNNDVRSQVIIHSLHAQFRSLQRQFSKAFNEMQKAIILAQDNQSDARLLIDLTQYYYYLDASRIDSATDFGEHILVDAQAQQLDNLALKVMFQNAVATLNEGNNERQIKAISDSFLPYLETSTLANDAWQFLNFSLLASSGRASEDHIDEYLIYLSSVQSKAMRFNMYAPVLHAWAILNQAVPTHLFKQMQRELADMPESSIKLMAEEQLLYHRYSIRRTLGIELPTALDALEQYMQLSSEGWRMVDMAAEQTLELDVRKQALNYQNELLLLENQSNQQALKNAEQAKTILILVVITTISLLTIAFSIVWYGITRYRQLHRQASTDGLTGLANRRTFDRTLSQLSQSGQQFGLLMIDADHFKHVNDRYGHDVGDQVLAHLSQIVTTSCRGSDVVCRYGGEEFAVLMPMVTDAQLARCAARICQAVESQPFNASTTELVLTVSIGGAICRQQGDCATLVTRADKRLYEAKRNGRNQFIISG